MNPTWLTTIPFQLWEWLSITSLHCGAVFDVITTPRKCLWHLRIPIKQPLKKPQIRFSFVFGVKTQKMSAHFIRQLDPTLVCRERCYSNCALDVEEWNPRLFRYKSLKTLFQYHALVVSSLTQTSHLRTRKCVCIMIAAGSRWASIQTGRVAFSGWEKERHTDKEEERANDMYRIRKPF